MELQEREFTYSTEAEAKEARRAMINAGRTVTLIGYDTSREVYAFGAHVAAPREDDNLEATLHELTLLAASGDQVQIGFTVSNGNADRLEQVYAAADAAEYIRAMQATLNNYGLTARFTLYRWER